MKNRIRQETTWEKKELGERREELGALKKHLSRMERILTKLRIELGTLRKIYSEILDPRIRELDNLKSNLPKSSESNQNNRTENVASPAGCFSHHQKREVDENSIHSDCPHIDDSPVDSFKDLYRKVAKAVHPDLSTNEEERKWRQKLMAEANNAYTRKDYESLRSILRQWENGPEVWEGEDISAELSLILRKISWTRERMRVVESEIEEMKNSDLYRLLIKVEEAQYEGVDLLAEMAKKIDIDIASIRVRLRKDAPAGKGNVSMGNDPRRLERLVSFPSEFKVGKLFCRNSSSESFLDWQFYGEARGEIGIPAGSSVRLDVSEGKGNTLSFLDNLGKNDLQALFLHTSADSELAHLQGLTGLQELYLSGKGITDAGMHELRKLKNLHRLYLYDTAITDIGAETLKGLAGLRCITLCGSCISENVMKNIKNFLPGCRIILLNRPSYGTG
jgi:hypothetical protein